MGSTSVTVLAGVISPPVVIGNGQATCFACNVEDRATAASGFPGGHGERCNRVKSVMPFAREYHKLEGNYLSLARQYSRQGKRYPLRVNSVVMTDEESYTCELCQGKFENIGAWRRHDGRDPLSGGKLTGDEGIALCWKG